MPILGKYVRRLVVSTAKETAERFDDVWRREKTNLPFSRDTITAIENHRKNLAI
jgi:serine/threonine-protein kinase HipA